VKEVEDSVPLLNFVYQLTCVTLYLPVSLYKRALFVCVSV